MRIGPSYALGRGRGKPRGGNYRHISGVDGVNPEGTDMRVPHNSFVVVADGEKLLFFRNDGDSDYLKLEVERKRQSENPASRDIKTDSPGRAFESVGNGRTVMGETEFHNIEEE